jgi:hypothetical protein
MKSSQTRSQVSRLKSFLLLSATLACISAVCPNAGHAQSSEVVEVPVPNGWTVANRERKGDLNLEEYIPPGQTRENHQSFISIKSYSKAGRKSGPSAQEYFERQKKEAADDCPGVAILPVKSSKENGYPSIFWWEYCPRNMRSGKGQISAFKVIQADAKFFIVQRTAYSRPFKLETPPFGKTDVENWSRFMKLSVGCDTQVGNCPSQSR